MAFQVTPNIALPALSDKVGAILITLKNALVATGKWRVRGSGDGRSAGVYQLMGQTAGPSFDVFTAAPGYLTNVTNWYPAWINNNPNVISNPGAWYVLEEIASGRVLMVQRNTGTAQYDPITISAAIATGVASTGAGPKTTPALTGTVAFLVGSQFNTAAYYGAETSDNGGNELNIGANVEHWAQFGASDQLMNTNVAPWWFAVWSRTQNLPVMGGLWEPLTDLDAAHAAQPFVAGFGAWSRVFGRVAQASEGGFRGASSALRGGAGFGIVAFERTFRGTSNESGNSSLGTLQLSPPAVQQIQSDGKFRAERPWCYQPLSGTRSIGRLTHFYVNRIAREYPTTYDVATANARITLGQLIGPWTQGTAPYSSP